MVQLRYNGSLNDGNCTRDRQKEMNSIKNQEGILQEVMMIG